MIPGTTVEVAYTDADGAAQVKRGTWHVDNDGRGSRGPLLVMNPAAWNTQGVCCWSILWDRVVSLTRVETAAEVISRTLLDYERQARTCTSETILDALAAAGFEVRPK